MGRRHGAFDADDQTSPVDAGDPRSLGDAGDPRSRAGARHRPSAGLHRRNVLVHLGSVALSGALAGLALPPVSPLRAQTVRGAAVPASGVALIMVDEAGCPYCKRWDADVGEAWAASAEGRFAPLVRIRITDPALARFGRLVYTPTFIVVRDGREVGRVTGYPGADFFWPLITDVLVRAGFSRSEGGGGAG